MALCTDEELDEFARIYEAEVGRPITRAEVLEMAARLITLYSILVGPLPNREETWVQSPWDEKPRLPSDQVSSS